MNFHAGATCEVFAGGPPLRIGDKGLEFELGSGSEGRPADQNEMRSTPFCSCFILPS